MQPPTRNPTERQVRNTLFKVLFVSVLIVKGDGEFNFLLLSPQTETKKNYLKIRSGSGKVPIVKMRMGHQG